MDIVPDDLIRRIHNAQESLDTELKPWIDPKSDSGKAVIARACMALRNNDGGFLIIGIRDDGSPDKRKLLPNVRKTFHSDAVQEIVSKYSSIRFEVAVHYVERDAMERVVIQVPPGVRIPVICRNNLPKANTTDGHAAGSLLAADTVYVRTLDANGRPSSAPAKVSDWPMLMERCFNNREADFGAFARRQLSSLNLPSVTSGLLEVLQAAKEPSPVEQVDKFLDECFARFSSLRQKHDPKPPDCGTRDAVTVILGDFPRPELTQEYMLQLGLNMQRYSGWSPWDGLFVNFHRGSGVAAVVNQGWESFYYDPTLFNTLDFSRIEEAGRFCYIEGLRDDLTNTVPKGTQLEFVGQTKSVTEILTGVLTFSKAFCGPESKNEIAVGIKWRRLSGRRLTSWAHPRRGFATRALAQDDECVSHVVLPVATPSNAVGPHVENLVKPLFRLFGGWKFDSTVLQQIVGETLRRSE